MCSRFLLPSQCHFTCSFSSTSFHFSFTLTVGVNVLENILIDRLYNAGVPAAGTRPPAFPFEKVIVTAITAVTAKPVAASSGISATGNTRYVRVHLNFPACTCFVLIIDFICLYMTRRNKFLLHISPSLTSSFFSSLVLIRSSTGTGVGAAAGAGAGALPQGWIRMVDPTSSRPYFVNHVFMTAMSVC